MKDNEIRYLNWLNKKERAVLRIILTNVENSIGTSNIIQDDGKVWITKSYKKLESEVKDEKIYSISVVLKSLERKGFIFKKLNKGTYSYTLTNSVLLFGDITKVFPKVCNVINSNINTYSPPIKSKAYSFLTNKVIKIKNDTPCLFYILRCSDENETFFKAGITSTGLSKRYSGNKAMPYNYSVVYEFYGKESICLAIEGIILRLIAPHVYIPKKKFIGQTECFSKEVILYDLGYIRYSIETYLNDCLEDECFIESIYETIDMKELEYNKKEIVFPF